MSVVVDIAGQGDDDVPEGFSLLAMMNGLIGCLVWLEDGCRYR